MEEIVKWQIKRFKELSLQELYSLLKLRSFVFVVEQNCVYQDVDGKDEKAIHILGVFKNNIVAYARIFDQGDYFEETSIGRVVVDSEFRGQNLGHELMKEAISAVKKHFNSNEITISAQLYLKDFYQSHGFIQTSDVYLEDNIPHIQMKII
jgi:ElaA protein